jgi:hypothetical protein
LSASNFACSGWATSQYIVSTFPGMNIAYFSGKRASSKKGDMLGRKLATLLPISQIEREANSTQ